MKFIYIKMSALSPRNLYLNFIVDHILARDKKTYISGTFEGVQY